MDLSGFSAFDFSEGVPYFSVTLNGLTFNKAVVLKLGSPAYVRLLINEESRQVVLQVCEGTTPKATTFYKPKKNGVLSVRWSSQDLVATFKRLLENDFREHGIGVFEVVGFRIGDLFACRRTLVNDDGRESLP